MFVKRLISTEVYAAAVAFKQPNNTVIVKSVVTTQEAAKFRKYLLAAVGETAPLEVRAINQSITVLQDLLSQWHGVVVRLVKIVPHARMWFTGGSCRRASVVSFDLATHIQNAHYLHRFCF